MLSETPCSWMDNSIMGNLVPVLLGNRNFFLPKPPQTSVFSLRSAHLRDCNKSRGQVPSCELTFFAWKSSRKLWSLRLVSQIQTGFNFWDKPLHLVPKTLRVNYSWDRSLRPVPSGKLFRGLVAGTSRRDFSPRVCDLYILSNFPSDSADLCKSLVLRTEIPVNLSIISLTEIVHQQSHVSLKYKPNWMIRNFIEVH